MHEILRDLPDGSIILDLGCARGSFRASEFSRCTVIRIDLDRWPKSPDDSNVIQLQADAAALPLQSHGIDFAVCNHSLEHISQLNDALTELGRVLKPGAPLFVSVPDASTLTDKVYRWLARGGGHVNAFKNADALARLIAERTDRPHCRTWTLFSSLSFVNRHNIHGRTQLKVALLFFGGNERFLAIFIRLLHALDRLFGTRLSVYGWGMYFGDSRVCHAVSEVVAHRNVCVRCGSTHSRTVLQGHIRRRFVLPRTWECPACGGWNLLI
jgi:SAM-dependent methyltransferase